MRTPWGIVQNQHTVVEGIESVSTAGHGGYVLSAERLRQMPDRFKLNVYGRGRYFEEDCEWALVVLAFHVEFPVEQVQAAIDTARQFYPTLGYLGVCWKHAETVRPRPKPLEGD